MSFCAWYLVISGVAKGDDIGACPLRRHSKTVMHSVCLQLLGASPQTPTAALTLATAGGFRPPDPLFCLPLSKFLATPLLVMLAANAKV